MSDIDKPAGYPMTANSGIYDAQAFSIGNSDKVHRTAKFPDGNKVIAVCGAYGFATERDSRIAHWRTTGWTCQRCINPHPFS